VNVWQQLVGQPDAIATFEAAARAAHAERTGGESADSLSAMTHAWLITGPPGSGRSNLAYAFAAALLCPRGGCGECADCRNVVARTHPDLSYLATERVIISIDEVREFVVSSQYSPSTADYRVVVIEDADRMAERTSNVLLKALEEPPARTVWILCAPSEADLIPTIRSRVRSVRLTVPSLELVAQLLQDRDGVDAVTAERSARLAQNHIGMARRLATNTEAAARREETVRLVLGMTGVSDAVTAAARLLAIATDDAKAVTDEQDADELEQTRRAMGISEGDVIPPTLRSQFRTLEEQQKRRATRSLRDGLDRILVDLMSVYRDVLRLQLGVSEDLTNLEFEAELRQRAGATTATETLAALDAVAQARTRISSNVAPLLTLEAMLIASVLPEAASSRRLVAVG
jgi:DNA polymerase-3 subunit delta'